MPYRINVGCGTTPTLGEGWKNYDNSVSITLARLPKGFVQLLSKMRLLTSKHVEAIERFRSHGSKIQRAECTKLPLPDNSVDVVYTSHMLEHLSREKAAMFVREACRVLVPGGTIRIAVPDFDVRHRQYLETKDTDAFIASLGIARGDMDKLSRKLRFLMTGDRSHKWMYNGKSLVELLTKCGFVDAVSLPAGETTIPEPGDIDLNERSIESAYAEAKKPSN